MTSRLLEFVSRCGMEAYPEPRTEGHDKITAQAAMVLARLLPLNARILDIGSGQGPALEWFTQNGFQIEGIDTNDENIRLCRALGYSVMKCDQNEMPEGLIGRYDCVWARHVLEHSPIPYFTLSEFHRVLKPEGILYAEMPAPDTSSLHETNPNHYSVLGLSMWLNLITRSGFDIFMAEKISGKTNQGEEEYFALAARKRLTPNA